MRLLPLWEPRVIKSALISLKMLFKRYWNLLTLQFVMEIETQQSAFITERKSK
jgi:hypothetical protein